MLERPTFGNVTASVRRRGIGYLYRIAGDRGPPRKMDSRCWTSPPPIADRIVDVRSFAIAA
jgi:hypothetical protein